MKKPNLTKTGIELLESRIAPATLFPNAGGDPKFFKALVLGTPIELFAGEMLSTGGKNSGSYLMFVEKGSAIVFTTDHNGNGRFDPNEITGIAAGDGLRLVSFVDIHGDIVTNLKETSITVSSTNGTTETKVLLTLSDSDNNPSNDSRLLQGDGRVLLNNSIEKIELRSLTLGDVSDFNGNGSVDAIDLDQRQPDASNYSIFGSIYAGKSFGADDGGLIFDPKADGVTVPVDYLPSVKSIRVGTAVNGQYYSFGVSKLFNRINVVSGQELLDSDPVNPVIVQTYLGDDLSGTMSPFVPAVGAAGGDINTVKSLADVAFTVDFLVAGKGGTGAAGGNIRNVAMRGDDSSGYQLIAGEGGTGRTGGDGGAIINFSDAGSHTGLVILSGGDGGEGTIGNGGNSGDSQFTTLNLKGNVHVDMGDGGRGFVNGGRGASLAKGIFTEPAALLTMGLNGWGTTHLPDSSTGAFTPRVGVQEAIDFNEDGFGDFVYSIGVPAQIIVLVSDPLNPGQFQSFEAADGSLLQGLYLNGPRNAHALSAGDVNGDGHVDIVTASRDFGGTGDLQVFLSKYEDLNNDGEVTTDEDLNGNGVNDFVGFYEARHSTLPSLGSDTFGIADVTIGDFDGDGRPELGVGTNGNAVFMMADRELNPVTNRLEYTGQFYYDYGRKELNIGGVVVPAIGRTSYVRLVTSGVDAVSVEATTLRNVGDTHDVLIASRWDSNTATTIDWSDRTLGVPIAGRVWTLTIVDLDRGLGFQPEPFSMYDFAMLDLDRDGNTDLAAIDLDNAPNNKQQSGFMKGSLGDGAGNGVSASGDGNNAGNYFFFASSLFTIRAMDGNHDGSIDDMLISDERGARPYLWGPGPDGVVPINFPNATPFVGGGSPGDNGVAESNHGFADPFFASLIAPLDTQSGFAAGGSGDDPLVVGGVVFTDYGLNGVTFVYPGVDYIQRGLTISAGNGGLGLVGSGGAGGFIGGASTVGAAVDATGTPIIDEFGRPVVDLRGAIQITSNVTVEVIAGIGGNGFVNGGGGGSISGVSIKDPIGRMDLNHRLQAGDGGRGVFGKGGAGGSLISNSLFNGLEFLAGNGGVGKFGGNGGSVVGSGASYDIYNSSVAVIAGDGGLGTSAGGNGGSIIGFKPRLPEPNATQVVGNPTNVAAVEDFLYYRAGDGGSAVSGRGGNGGSVTNSNPDFSVRLEGAVVVFAGDGGIGNSGGNGGSITNFNLLMYQDLKPSRVTFIGGKGGDAFTGKGGIGGNVENLDIVGLAVDPPVPMTGQWQTYQLSDGTREASRFVFNRIIAGAGGNSSGNEGGLGGSVVNIRALSPDGGFVFVGGAGGDGLRKGGSGGSAVNIRPDFGTGSKVLVASGEGGDAGAFIFNPIDPTPNQPQNAFGGRVGRGGNGGNIVGVFQSGAIDPHMDLVAGDGGSTIHFGTFLDKKGFVGVGGSILNVKVSANIGNSTPTVQIKGYNDVLNNESFADFVRTDLFNEAQPAGIPDGTLANIDDRLGNVGAIVGAAGRNKSYVLDPDNNPTLYTSIAAKNGINGSFKDIVVRNLMVAVAGSVDRIASIQTYQAVTATQSTGADKNPRIVVVPGGDPLGTEVANFASASGIPTTSGEPELEGIMVDGAIVGKKFLNAQGKKIIPPLNGYIRI